MTMHLAATSAAGTAAFTRGIMVFAVETYKVGAPKSCTTTTVAHIEQA